MATFNIISGTTHLLLNIILKIDIGYLIVVFGVDGDAIGAAVTILGLVDIVYASDQSTFITPFSRLGLVPDACSTATFPRYMISNYILVTVLYLTKFVIIFCV